MTLISIDVGNPSPVGSVSTGNDFDVTGSGANVWNNSDQFHLAYQQVTGSFTAIVRVAGVTSPGDAIAGIMARATLDPNSVNAYARVYQNPAEPFKLGARSITGSSTASFTANTLPGYPNAFIKLTRDGNTFEAHSSADGIAWTRIGITTVTMPATIFLGLAVCSRQTGQSATASFKGFTIGLAPATEPPPPSNVPLPPTIASANPTIEATVVGVGLPSLSQSSTKYKLDAGIFLVATPRPIKGHDIVIEGTTDANGKPATTLSWKGTDLATMSAIDASSDKIEFRNINFQFPKPPAGKSGMAVRNHGSNVTFDNCTVDQCQLVQLLGSNGTKINKCTAGVVPMYWVYADEETRNGVKVPNVNTVITDCVVGGSIAGHAIRTYNVDGFWVIGGSIKNPGSITRPPGVVSGEALNFLDGKNYYVTTNVEGPCRSGPLGNYNNANKASHVIFSGCVFKDTMLYLESGLSDATVQDSNGGLKLTVRKSVYGRPMPTGVLTRINALGIGKFASVESTEPLSHYFQVTDVKFNGVPQ